MKHIAIFRQPFYDMVISGEKTIESRWSMKKVVPYGKIKSGDVLLIKQTGKDVTATAMVQDVQFYELTPTLVDEIKGRYGKEIGIDKFDNWEAYRNKKYLTLIWLKDVKEIKPLKVKKSNDAGWMIVR